ncbi:BTBD13 [Mytilus edulis]|uniref:BTBD13 n=1 Tax=Mytilus edulis TaxID=6550 RepID=A0A8S3RN07_MYTED|nr:BTBD13 [Mytilus edulis]
MGNKLAKLGSPNRQSDKGTTSLKRKRLQDNDSTDEEEEMHTPKKKRLPSTSKYIYQKLFLDGENSDITITASGKEWFLHKVYLSQSPYFSCMFNGSWSESSSKNVVIDVADPNIDETALKITFGSLYQDYIFIKPVEVVGVLATAILLQLEGLIQHCKELMTDTLSSKMVHIYYEASQMYGLQELEKDCFNWLLSNFLANKQDQNFLKNISIDLMTRLVVSPDLYVMQVEVDVYSQLKKWVFLQENPSWDSTAKNLTTDAADYFKQLHKENPSECFLKTEKGKLYLPVFCKIRWQHVINDLASLKLVEDDKVFHLAWIQPFFEQQWKKMLTIEQGRDHGPDDVPEEDIFNKNCFRCGRALPVEGDYCWRWVGYSYGIDLLVSYSNSLISIKRNTHSQLCPGAVSLHPYRKLKVASVDEKGRTTTDKSTVLTRINLLQDTEHVVMLLDKKFNMLHIYIAGTCSYAVRQEEHVVMLLDKKFNMLHIYIAGTCSYAVRQEV